MLKPLLLTALLLLPLTSQADFYKYTDEKGRVIFTDTPPSIGAEKHELESINEVENPTYNMDKLNMTIPFTEENGTMVVNGEVNGVRMRFVVDTGASYVAIPPAIAKNAGLSKSNSRMVSAQTANGTIQVPYITIDTLQIAKVKQNGVEGTIQSISDSDNKLGLLGMSFFDKYKMTINREKREILLEQK